MPRITVPTPRINLNASQIRWIALFVVMGLMVLSSASTFAQTQAPSLGILDGIGAAFQAKQKGWGEIISKYAKRLFWLLAVIDFSYLCATYVLDKKEMDDLFFSILKKLMTLGFFFTVLKTSYDWIPQIINSFKQIGQEAGGTTAGSPDGVAVAGYDAAIGVFQILKELKLSEQLVAVLPSVLMALIIFLSFLWVAAQLLVAQVETTLAVGAGIILLGFGGSKWTTDMASKYMQYAVATGLKMMMLFLLVGTGQNLFEDIHLVSGDDFLPSLLRTAGTAIMYGFLATKIPAIASAMMSGSPSLTAGDMTGAVLGAGAAIAGLGAAGMMATKAAGGAAVGSAAGATGVAKALGAGIDSGLDLGKSGAGLAAHALGEAGSHGLGLAAGAVGDKIAGGASSFGQMVDQSAGGRVATSIQASRGGSMAGVTAQSGGEASTGSPPGAAGSTPAAGNASSQANNANASTPSVPPVEAAQSAGTAATDQIPESLALGDAATVAPSGNDVPAPGAASGATKSAGVGTVTGDVAGQESSGTTAGGAVTAPLSQPAASVASQVASPSASQAGVGAQQRSTLSALADSSSKANGNPMNVTGTTSVADASIGAGSGGHAKAAFPSSPVQGGTAYGNAASQASSTPPSASAVPMAETAQGADAPDAAPNQPNAGSGVAAHGVSPVADAAPSASGAARPAAQAAGANTPVAGGSGGATAAGASASPISSPSGAGAPSPTAPQGTSRTSSGAHSRPVLSALAGAGLSADSTPTSLAGTQPLGDASNGAVTGGGDSKGGRTDQGAAERRSTPLHERMRDLKGYVPDDAAQAATVHIDLKHAE